MSPECSWDWLLEWNHSICRNWGGSYRAFLILKKICVEMRKNGLFSKKNCALCNFSFLWIPKYNPEQVQSAWTALLVRRLCFMFAPTSQCHRTYESLRQWESGAKKKQDLLISDWKCKIDRLYTYVSKSNVIMQALYDDAEYTFANAQRIAPTRCWSMVLHVHPGHPVP